MHDPLDNWRKQIDTLDEELLHILSKRIHIVKKIGRYKKENHMPPLDARRWQEVLETKLLQADVLGLSKSFIMKLYTVIHDYALEIEENIKL